MVTAVNACIKHGVYAIIDWHVFGDPSEDLAKDFFTNMSKTFTGKPNVIYEIWNEPDGSGGTWPIVKAYAETIIDIIRQNDPNNVIIVGTPTYSQRVDQAAADPVNRTNIAYALHYYADTHKQSLRDLAAGAINQSLPIFITEYGTVQASGLGPINVNETYLWWEFNDQYQLSYVNWGLFDGDDGNANLLLRGAGPGQVGDPSYWTTSGKLVNKKYRSTDQGVFCSSLGRIDCHPEPGNNQAECTQRGCVYDTNINFFDPNSQTPQCYFPYGTGYVSEVAVNSSTTITLKKSSASPKNPFGTDFDELNFQTVEIGSGLRITISPKGTTRYQPPVPINFNPTITSSEKLNIVKQNGSIFSFLVQRQSTGTNIWDTSIGGLLFADQYLQIATYLPTSKIYGFGEHYHQTLKHNTTVYKTWGMWARDIPPMPDTNLYGVHPFYLGLEDDGNAHGVLIFNSNAQDITIGPAPHLVYRTIGGQFDIFYFPGPTPEQVIQQYSQVIGTTFMPSYWALGFHICRYGYGSTNDLKTIVNRTWAANIPFDTAWADINYMDNLRDFTLGNAWLDLGNYTDFLHSQGMHVILITDPAIEADYDSFQRGRDLNASFIEWPRADLVPQNINNQYPMCNGTNIMLGAVWPNNLAAFPDFLDPSNNTKIWWSGEFAKFRQLVSLDGIWIDMNEPSVFNTKLGNGTFDHRNQDYHGNESLYCPGTGPDSKYDVPPYLTYSGYHNGPFLATATLCLVGVSTRRANTVYDTKNLYGWSEMVATQYAHKQAIGKRGAVISRSTFPSSGSYGGHWTGDIYSSWDDLKNSIIGIQEFNMFGIPFVGADICGFRGKAEEEMCLRWQQLGAFYPFMRNHADGESPQDPAYWPSVAEASRKANLFRYRHLPYLYSFSATFGQASERCTGFQQNKKNLFLSKFGGKLLSKTKLLHRRIKFRNCYHLKHNFLSLSQTCEILDYDKRLTNMGISDINLLLIKSPYFQDD